ncbi:MAG: hypothetical protein JHC33_01905 [Ignisphaera sp.]|nr:hypothetical protein [Ignisphaera sp.]
MFLQSIYKMAENISKLSGVIDSTSLWLYKTKPEDLFSSHVVKKETTVFKPSAGMAFKVR